MLVKSYNRQKSLKTSKTDLKTKFLKSVTPYDHEEVFIRKWHMSSLSTTIVEQIKNQNIVDCENTTVIIADFIPWY